MFFTGRRAPPQAKFQKLTAEDLHPQSAEIEGHWDFGDGRKRTTDKAFLDPESEALKWVNVMLGNDGPEPDLSGGMIPAVAPPFGMTRWTPQTRQNFVSMCPYNQTDTKLHGFLGTHQPAIWMGESGPSQISAGLGAVVTDFDKRGLPFQRSTEYASANYYTNVLDAGVGDIFAEMTATSRVGHLRFTFESDAAPHIVVQASRESIVINQENTPFRKTDNVTFPDGEITIDRKRREVFGWNDERQDRILVGDDLPAKSFKGYFVARFSEPFEDVGISRYGELEPGVTTGTGKVLAGYVTFSSKKVEVRVGVSFISIEQARRNINLEIPDGQTLETTSRQTRSAWSDKLDRLTVSGATPQNRTVLFSSFAHTLVYPYEISEDTSYYSGYVDEVVKGTSYSGYSIWDTFRAETAWLLFLAPERVGGMISSMLQDYQQGGWLPMWKNLVETNIMVGTHSDVIIAQAMQAGVRDFDWREAWEAVKKDAYQPPDRDTELRFEDREEHTPQEVRAGLTEYMELGYVADDLHSESGSRTLDYAYDDWAASIVARHVGHHEDAEKLLERSKSYHNIWNAETGFMEAKRSDGTWAGEKAGWTEGDHWAYSLTVMHDVPGLIGLMGGNKSFVQFLDRHFDGGHNLHTNEPSHHIPYLYMYAGAPHKTQERVLHVGQNDYNHTALGLSGNEDCGQMSAWYLFSALGFYPVDPASATYVIGTPFFDNITLQLPGASRPLSIHAKGASDRSKYIKSVTIDGKQHDSIFITHEQIKNGADIVFEMDATPQVWGF
ncbi:glycosyl hydrolase family 92-domain-containing protein [Naematelia encephala]|uniref:Glycosyl hydrolase family 92-domain-containing protein n=1 Tax=Naematelia encephala TaxID=71784 RepID=A0A1Y2AU59_9TREE|nr:glycosyl hydrolase family 92-domain-containing protein [Naematelia encephala]